MTQSVSKSINRSINLDFYSGLSSKNRHRIHWRRWANVQEMSWKSLRKEIGFQSLAKCRQWLSRRVPDSWADNWESPVGYSWQPDEERSDRRPGDWVVRVRARLHARTAILNLNTLRHTQPLRTDWRKLFFVSAGRSLLTKSRDVSASVNEDIVSSICLI